MVDHLECVIPKAEDGIHTERPSKFLVCSIKQQLRINNQIPAHHRETLGRRGLSPSAVSLALCHKVHWLMPAHTQMHFHYHTGDTGDKGDTVTGDTGAS